MNTSKHTPAPWEQAPDAFFYVTDQHGNALAHVIDSHMPEKETRANARLIAAAPELLTALEEITLAYVNARVRLNELEGAADETPLIQKARMAIAKARE